MAALCYTSITVNSLRSFSGQNEDNLEANCYKLKLCTVSSDVEKIFIRQTKEFLLHFITLFGLN